MKPTTFVVGALTASTLAAVALAHGGATGIVKERMDAMGEMRDAVKTISPMMSGEAEYDAEAVREAAETIQGHGGESLTEMFPEGTTDAPSEAKPAIWNDWERFTGLADQLETAATGLAEAVPNGVSDGGSADMGSMMGDTSSMMGDTSSMMGSGGMSGGGMMSAEQIAEMPANRAFAMTTQVCSSCHTAFRAEDD